MKSTRKTERILITDWPRKDRRRAINLTETYITAFVVQLCLKIEKRTRGILNARQVECALAILKQFIS